MTTKYQDNPMTNIKINPEFKDLFDFDSKEEKIEHKAQMISYRVISEIEKVCEEKKIKRKDLAAMVNTSKSYITQLFRGNKHINTIILARIEAALDVSFQIKIKLNEDSNEDFISKQIPPEFFSNARRMPSDGYIMYYFAGGKKQDKTDEILDAMKTENFSKQKAG